MAKVSDWNSIEANLSNSKSISESSRFNPENVLNIVDANRLGINSTHSGSIQLDLNQVFNPNLSKPNF